MKKIYLFYCIFSFFFSLASYAEENTYEVCKLKFWKNPEGIIFESVYIKNVRIERIVKIYSTISGENWRIDKGLEDCLINFDSKFLCYKEFLEEIRDNANFSLDIDFAERKFLLSNEP